jgi:ribosomal protein L16 Arg81 hydroxylase
MLIDDADIATSTAAQSLSRLIEPCQIDEFFSHHWQKAPLLIQNKTPRRFEHLFTIDRLDELFNVSSANANDYDFITGRSSIARENFTGPGNHILTNRLLGLYRDGGTIHISNLNKYDSGVDKVCKSLSEELGCEVEADLWLTSQNKIEPYFHCDGHDIITLQIFGKKRWRVYPTETFVENNVGVPFSESELGEPLFDVEFGPGDLLYMPAGTPHAVTTCVEHSLHIGLGVHPLTWRKVAEAAFGTLGDKATALSHAVNREILSARDPVRLQAAFAELLARVANEIDYAALQKRLDDDAIQSTRAPKDRHLTANVICDGRVGWDTLLVRRGTAPITVAREGDFAIIKFDGGGIVHGPAGAEALFRGVASASGVFRAADFRGCLAEDMTLAALNELIQRGLLMRV